MSFGGAGSTRSKSELNLGVKKVKKVLPLCPWWWKVKKVPA